MKEKIDIRNIGVEELQKFCKDNNLPKFRAKQVEEWLWKKGASSFAEMTSLSKKIQRFVYCAFCYQFRKNPQSRKKYRWHHKIQHEIARQATGGGGFNTI